MERRLKEHFNRAPKLYPVDPLSSHSLMCVGYTTPIIDTVSIPPGSLTECPCFASQRRPLSSPRSIIPLIGPARHMKPWQSHETSWDKWKSERRWWIYLVNRAWELEHVETHGQCWYCGNPSKSCSVDFGQTFCAELSVDHRICRHQSAIVKRSGNGTYAVWTYWNSGTLVKVCYNVVKDHH